MKKRKAIFIAVSLLGIGSLLQIGESVIDKPAVQNYVETTLKENDSYSTDFNFKDEGETNFFKWLGF